MENINLDELSEHVKPVSVLDIGDVVAVHQNYKVLDTEKYGQTRTRARGSFLTPSFEDFKSFVEHEQEGHALIFVNHQEFNATAVLNYGGSGEQGHCDYLATLQLEPTIAWKKLSQLKGHKLDQRAFAIFLEDWASVLSATNSNGGEIAIGSAINSVRTMVVSASASSETTMDNMAQSSSSMDQIEAKAKIGDTPAYFTLNDQVFLGLEEREIKLRVVINTNDGKPTFALQITKEELLLNEITQEFKEKVGALLPDNPVRIGTFKA